MTKKKWLGLLLMILLLLGAVKLFYKTWNETTVAKSADCIVSLDVKRIINTAIWQIITTPGLWKFSSGGPKSDMVSWDDMIKLPDYVFVFHAAGQPDNAWYSVVSINDKDDFNKGLLQYHFEKQGEIYTSKENGISFFQSGDQLLVSNLPAENKDLILQVADELFNRKQFINKEKLAANVKAASHLAMQVGKNNFLLNDAIISANFDKTSINIDAVITPQKPFNFTESSFNYNSNSLCALGFGQPSAALYNLFNDSARAGISRAINFNIDSFVLPTNMQYQLDLAAIQSRVDSAISYTYDDNFNPVEKVVVNNVQEPAFSFTVRGNGATNVYQYLQSSGKLEKTENGALFTPMPFVKSFASQKENNLQITANNYQPGKTDQSEKCILFLHILFSKIPADLVKYLPGDVIKVLSNIESIKLTAKKSNEQIKVHCSFSKKKNDKMVVEL